MRVLTLTEAIKKRLEEMIRKGELAAGEKIVVDDLAARFAVSQTPVREALSRLEQEKLVVYQPRNGWKVVSFTRQDYLKYYEVQEMLERYLTEKMVDYADRVDLDELELRNENCLHFIEKRKPDRASEENDRFHAEIYMHYPNEILFDMLRDVINILSCQRKMMFADKDIGKQLYQEHRDIIQAFRKKDVKMAAAAMYRHFRTGFEGLEGTFAAEDAGLSDTKKPRTKRTAARGGTRGKRYEDFE
jgi:DNA-binding GntR family transcriptional regulator